MTKLNDEMGYYQDPADHNSPNMKYLSNQINNLNSPITINGIGV